MSPQKQKLAFKPKQKNSKLSKRIEDNDITESEFNAKSYRTVAKAPLRSIDVH